MFILVKCYRISKWMMFSNNVSSLCPKHVLQLLFQLPHANGPTAQGQDLKANLKRARQDPNRKWWCIQDSHFLSPHTSVLTLLDFMTMCLSLRGFLPIAPIIRFCDHTEQQQKGKWMLGWVNVISTESLETLNSHSGWTTSDLRLAQNTAVILSFHSCLWSYWLCSFLFQFKVLCDVADLPRASFPSTAHHPGYSLTASHCGHPLIFWACLLLPNPDDFLPLLLPVRRWSTAPSKAAFSVLMNFIFPAISCPHFYLVRISKVSFPAWSMYSLTCRKCLKSICYMN